MICKFSNEYLIESFTMVDNLFLSEYMPYADEKQIKVYLYGLFLCNAKTDENSFELMTKVLDMTSDEIVSAFAFWQDNGLVEIISRSPLEIKYLSFKQNLKPIKKYKSEKFADFNAGLQKLFPDRMLTPNEYNEYYNFLDGSHMEQNALLMVVQYCINLKGVTVRYPYILTVARSWVADGVLTVDDVENKLNEYETQSEDMRAVLKALNRKGGAELEEKQMLLKWTKNWGYEISAIVYLAKHIKSKTFKKLDSTLDEYYRLAIYTENQMKDYLARRENLYNLAIKINKTLGVFYESLDNVIETYTVPWTEKGFDEDTLLKIAHYCFVSGVKNLSGMNAMVDKFHAMGIMTVDGINNYINKLLSNDETIKEILAKSGEIRGIINSDREYFRIWESTWGFSKDMIKYAAEQAAGKTYPIKYINQLLASYKQKGIDTVEKAKTFKPAESPAAKPRFDYDMREYTKEELATIFNNSKNFDGSDIE